MMECVFAEKLHLDRKAIKEPVLCLPLVKPLPLQQSTESGVRACLVQTQREKENRDKSRANAREGRNIDALPL